MQERRRRRAVPLRAAAIGLMPDGGTPRSFVVSGMMTDAEWKIYVGLMNKLGPSGPVQPPFSAVRIS